MEKMVARAEPATTKISLSTNNHGFSLIEIIIVLGIIVALLSIAAPRLATRQANIKDTARDFLVLVKDARNRAKLTHSTMRIVFKMNANEHQYWVEKSNGPQLIDPEQLINETMGRQAEETDKEKMKKSAFSMDEVLTKKKKSLPKNIFFNSIQTSTTKKVITDDLAFIHIFPEGNMEASVIQLTDRKKITWSLYFNPITGIPQVATQAQSLEEFNQ